jgi:hypothetical protein
MKYTLEEALGNGYPAAKFCIYHGYKCFHTSVGYLENRPLKEIRVAKIWYDTDIVVAGFEIGGTAENIADELVVADVAGLKFGRIVENAAEKIVPEVSLPISFSSGDQNQMDSFSEFSVIRLRRHSYQISDINKIKIRIKRESHRNRFNS